ncbi:MULTISPECIES: MerR family transcriptional regulator [unclassified Achromobacter]|uniref:MerR family transcriptional regulator n=1 Tax=unclassified Achromobacter TaxID=2626865 RepID=UPI000B516D27|nr:MULTISPECIES: MerR family transcriptional regulator [unclassified Achromobacter]OWT80557.1 MerR family transcriptional regulator [Achromobacter sp. HZ34]OWT82440.1 MerR family transcriptional regulator [Achromobacter sp. HZ28]
MTKPDDLQVIASEAARRLGVSIKALRLYEQHGLVTPGRSTAGYRLYGPDDMARAGEVVALRALGLSLAQVAAVLDGTSESLEAALREQQGVLDREILERVRRLDRLRDIQSGLARGTMPAGRELADIAGSSRDRQRWPGISFELPWPWAGESFELADIRPLNYIIGSLGSGKTRLALRIAESLPGARFLGLDRVAADNTRAALHALDGDADLRQRVEQAIVWLMGDGAERSDALAMLLAAFEADGSGAVVVDMVEQDLSQPTQEALIAYLRLRAALRARPLFLMTRSSSILDLAAVGPDEAIILCPANHSPPTRVAPYPRAPGYEAVATCLATPEARARIARRPETA